MPRNLEMFCEDFHGPESVGKYLLCSFSNMNVSVLSLVLKINMLFFWHAYAITSCNVFNKYFLMFLLLLTL